MSNMVKEQQKNPKNKPTPRKPQLPVQVPGAAAMTKPAHPVLGAWLGTPGPSAAPAWDEPPQQQPGGPSPPGEQTEEATATAPRGDSLPAPRGTEPAEQRWHRGHNSLPCLVS